MNLFGINLTNKFKNLINITLLDLSNGKYKLEPQMYNYYLNKYTWNGISDLMGLIVQH